MSSTIQCLRSRANGNETKEVEKGMRGVHGIQFGVRVGSMTT